MIACSVMPHGLKLVTCCYCGARSTLRSEGGQRLVCHGCGPPLAKIEALSLTPRPRADAAPARRPSAAHRAERPGEHRWKDRPARRKKGKRRRGGLLHRLGKVFDDIDDLFDDIFD